MADKNGVAKNEKITLKGNSENNEQPSEFKKSISAELTILEEDGGDLKRSNSGKSVNTGSWRKQCNSRRKSTTEYSAQSNQNKVFLTFKFTLN